MQGKARRTIPAVIVGLFVLATAAETVRAQPGHEGHNHCRRVDRRVVRPSRTGLQIPPKLRGARKGPRARRGAPPTVRRRPGNPDRRRGRGTARRLRRGRPAGKALTPGKATVPAAKAPTKVKVLKPSQKEAQRLAQLKKKNKDQGVVGAQKRKLKVKGGLANQILFYILFSLIICFSLVTITRKSPLMAALSLLVVFLGLAGVYLFLQAPFMAAIQLIVYAGAVIVLFVFVIMSIGFDEERSVEDLGKEILYFAMAFMLTGAGAFVFHAGTGWMSLFGFAAMELLALAFIILGKLRYPVTRFLGIAAVTFALAQVVRLVQLSPVLIGKTVGLKTAMDAKTQAYAATADGSYGNARSIGQSVFTDNVFAFEALSLLLLAAIVAAVVIARSRKGEKEQTS